MLQIIKSKSSKFIIVALFVYLQIILTEINNEVCVFKLYVVFVVLAFFFFTNGQWDDWWRNYVNRSSYFCGHHKQTAVWEDVLLPPSCAWGRGKDAAQNISTKKRWGIAAQGQHCCLQEVSVGNGVAPVRPVDLQAPSSLCPGWVRCETMGGSAPAPTSARLAWHPSAGRYLRHCFTE